MQEVPGSSPGATIKENGRYIELLYAFATAVTLDQWMMGLRRGYRPGSSPGRAAARKGEATFARFLQLAARGRCQVLSVVFSMDSSWGQISSERSSRRIVRERRRSEIRA
jgi:hypothetical protein